MGLEENKAVVQRLYDAINNGRLDELPQVVASDVVDHNAVIFMQPEGPGGVEEGVRMLLQGFPDLQLLTQELLAEGDQGAPAGPVPNATERLRSGWLARLGPRAARGPRPPQLTALFTSALILASSAAVNSFRAKEVGHMLPSSRFAVALKPNVAYLSLNFDAGVK
jgi:SnoaL-like polyketide cyclase